MSATEEEDWDKYNLDEPPRPDPYTVLNVSRDATKEQIMTAYKDLSRTFHPDRQNHSIRPGVSDQFIRICQSKDILTDDAVRQAYDEYGFEGVDMMMRDIYGELRSWRIGKKLRNPDALPSVLKYYMRRDAESELAKLYSSYGQMECALDASLFFDEMVDFLSMKTAPMKFADVVWNGAPIYVIEARPTDREDEQGYPIFEFDTDKPLTKSEKLKLNEAMTNADMSLLDGFDFTKLKSNRGSIRPKASSCRVTHTSQINWNDTNTFRISGAQDLSMGGASSSSAVAAAASQAGGQQSSDARIFCQGDLEWLHQYSSKTKISSSLSVGSGALNGQCVVSRNISRKQSIEFGIHADFLSSFWGLVSNGAAAVVPSFLNGGGSSGDDEEFFEEIEFVDDGEDEERFGQGENGEISLPSLDLMDDFGTSSDTTETKQRGDSLFDRVMAPHGYYPGFDLSLSSSRRLWDSWIGIGSVRAGRHPHLVLGLVKHKNKRKINIDLTLGGRSIGLEYKYTKRFEKRMRWFVSLRFNTVEYLKIEFGLSRTFLHDDLESSLENGSDSIGGVDVRGNLSVSYGLRDGLKLNVRIGHGPTKVKFPITLQKDANWRHVVTAFAIPALVCASYYYWYAPRARESRRKHIESQLARRGLQLLEKKQLAFMQMEAMKPELKYLLAKEEAAETTGLVILQAWYGKDVYERVKQSVRKWIGIQNGRDGSGSGDSEDEDDENGNGDRFDENYEDEDAKRDEFDEHSWTPGNSNGDWGEFEVFDATEDEGSNTDRRRNGRESTGTTSSRRRRRMSSRMLAKKKMKHMSDIEWSEIDITEPIDDPNEDHLLPTWMNVTVPCQYLVSRSRLVLQEGTKATLAGFYDVCPDAYDGKELLVVYRVGSQRNGNDVRYCRVFDRFPVELPNETDHEYWAIK